MNGLTRRNFAHTFVRMVLGFVLLVNSSLAFAEPTSQVAYLVVRATLDAQQRKQPTWICMANRVECKHIAANEPVVSISPGSYRLDHIDFGPKESDKKGTQIGNSSLFFKTKTMYRFEAGNIYFIGDIKLSDASMRTSAVHIDYDAALIYQACKAAPDIFKLYPLSSHAGDKKTKLKCHTN